MSTFEKHHDLLKILQVYLTFDGVMIIDGIHIPLANLLSKKVTLVVGVFFNKKKFHSIVLEVVCDANKIFQNMC
jgi:hypothetical protein